MSGGIGKAAIQVPSQTRRSLGFDGALLEWKGDADRVGTVLPE